VKVGWSTQSSPFLNPRRDHFQPSITPGARRDRSQPGATWRSPKLPIQLRKLALWNSFCDWGIHLSRQKRPNDWQQIELDVGGGGEHVGQRWTAAALSSLVCRQAERVEPSRPCWLDGRLLSLGGVAVGGGVGPGVHRVVARVEPRVIRLLGLGECQITDRLVHQQIGHQ